ncbi:hypothetical protein JK636_15430 [Clostridium sp. YIM B02515]|uniref:Uncharacterized protein n=1 Tax=Clostridium rhizosphaerae TaxID=2803861 RepID=A0ABS1TCR7_9CLOT|nr:hypothetical protein [Clostridium rhizosphaerae]MBL4937141.1 hypothetical protein [Clostridium rhizosphaerae]
MIKTIGNIRGFVKRTSEGIKESIPPITRPAELITDALCSPKYIQRRE